MRRLLVPLVLALAACPGARTTSLTSPRVDGPGDDRGASAGGSTASQARLVLLILEEHNAPAPALAVLATGTAPRESGIVGDRWWSRDERRMVRADEAGGLRGTAIGDVVTRRGGKAIAIARDPAMLRLVVGERGTLVAGRTSDGSDVVSLVRSTIKREALGQRRSIDLLVTVVPASAIAELETIDAVIMRAELRSDDAGRIGPYTVEEVRVAANNAASLELGGGDWIAAVSPPSIYLSPAALGQRRVDLKKAMRKVIFALRSFPELAIADRADAYEGECERRDDTAKQLCLVLDPARSGDFVVIARGQLLLPQLEALQQLHARLVEKLGGVTGRP